MSSDAVSPSFYHHYLPGARVKRITTLDPSPIVIELFRFNGSIHAKQFPSVSTHILAIVTEGRGDASYQLRKASSSTSVVLKPGSTLFFEIGQSSTWSIEASDLHFLAFYIPPEQIYRTMTQYGMDPRPFDADNTFINHDPIIRHLGQGLAYTLTDPETEKPSTLATSITQTIVLRLLQHRHTSHLLDNPIGEGFSPEISTTIRTYVRQHLDEHITVHDLAKVVDMSPSHFSRLFKKVTGETPYQYVLHERIKEAQRLLQGLDISIVEVALRTGFSDQSHLTRRFRKATGTTPAAYRRAVRQ